MVRCIAYVHFIFKVFEVAKEELRSARYRFGKKREIRQTGEYL